MCLARQKHFPEAESALLAAHDHLVGARSPATPNVLVGRAVAAPIDLYGAWGKPDKAAAWRARAAAPPKLGTAPAPRP